MIKKTILVIEDDGDICEILRVYLVKEGFHVELANDGKEGYVKAKKMVPDLLILDLMIPLMPGEEVCKAIRENEDPRLKKVPILMLTGRSKDSDRVIGKVIGASSYMTKPFKKDDLIREVKKLVGKA